MNSQHTEKLQKVLAREALGSRRELERWIADGRISVNGRIAKLGDRVSLTDLIHVDGRLIPIASDDHSPPRVLLYHKPAGEICTRHDDEGRPTVFVALPLISSGRWISVGRLDLNTAGILLFTNDGALANQLMHPSRAIEHEYAVRVLGEVSDENLSNVMRGVPLEDGIGRFDRLIDAGGQGANHWYHVVLTESRHRLIRRLWESQGITVSRLIHIRLGPILLPRELKESQWMELSASQVKQLTNLSG